MVCSGAPFGKKRRWEYSKIGWKGSGTTGEPFWAWPPETLSEHL